MLAHRHARPEDIPRLVDLVESAYRGAASRAGWTTEEGLLGGQRVDAGMIADILADPSKAILIVDPPAINACVAVENRQAHGYIGLVTVRPVAQAQGLGRALLALAEAYLATVWRLPVARMTVIAQRPELIAWYERRGYQLTGEQEAFPYGDARYGLPKRDDLYFVVLEKQL